GHLRGLGLSAVAADLGTGKGGSRLGGQAGDRGVGEDEVGVGGGQSLLHHAEGGEVAAVSGDDEEPVDSGIGELAHDRGDEGDEQLGADVDRAGQEAVVRGDAVVDAGQDEGSVLISTGAFIEDRQSVDDGAGDMGGTDVVSAQRKSVAVLFAGADGKDEQASPVLRELDLERGEFGVAADVRADLRDRGAGHYWVPCAESGSSVQSARTAALIASRCLRVRWEASNPSPRRIASRMSACSS